MKIGLVSPHLPEQCGVALYSHNLLTSLSKNGGVRVVSIGDHESNADYLTDFSSWSLLESLQKIVIKEKLDLLHFQYNAPHYGKHSLNFGLLRALKYLSIPCIVTLHEVQYPHSTTLLGSARLRILQSIEKSIIKYANRVIVHTPNQASFLNKKYQTKKVSCIYHGLELKKNTSKKGKNLLFFGIMNPNKGVHHLISAMKQLPEYHLMLAGSVPDKNYQHQLQELMGKNANIHSHFGWIDEKKRWDYFSSADIIILPYNWAPYQSGVLHNAVSMGKPVVVTKVGALWELASQFGLGEIIVKPTPTLIANATKKVYQNYATYKKGMSNYQKAANWSAVAKQHKQLYNSQSK